jgi:exonuclease III
MGISNLHNAKKGDNLTILHQNIRGLSGKINEFIIHISEIKPHLICFSEHHIKDMELNSPHIPSYKLGATYYRNILKWGGVCIYINESIEYSNINLNQYCMEQDLEVTALKFKFNKRNFIILCGYRAPSGDFQYLIENLDYILSFLQKTDTKLILCGDFNTNYAENSQNKYQLEYLLETYTLKDTVYFPTRMTVTTSTVLDNIFIDKLSIFTIKPHINGLSDHDAQVIILDDEITRKQISKTTLTRSFNDTNISTFLNYLSHENWGDVFMESDTNSMFNNFLNIFLRRIYHSFPIHRKRVVTPRQNKWITKGIVVSCKRKKELYILSKYTHDQQIKAFYKKYCAILTKVIHTAKKLYYKQTIEKSNNKIKATWHIINEEKGITKRKFAIKKISHNNRLLTNPKYIADLFNNYFISMADLTKMDHIKDLNHFIESSLKYLKMCHKNTFENIVWKYVSSREVERVIGSLKNLNSAGYDEITTRLLKLSTPYIVSSLTYICNSVLQTGVFPNRLKYASVTPIYKKVNSFLMSNYRPISVLTAFSKIFEKIMYKRIINHIHLNHILTPHQFGFRKNLSTEQAIFSLIYLYK